MTGEYRGNLFTVQVVSSFASTRLLLLKCLLLLLVSFVLPSVCLSIHLSMYLSIYLTTCLSISISRSISSPYLYLYLCYSALMPIPEYICDSPTQSYSSNCRTRTCQECSASRAATAFVANTSASLCSRYSGRSHSDNPYRLRRQSATIQREREGSLKKHAPNPQEIRPTKRFSRDPLSSRRQGSRVWTLATRTSSGFRAESSNMYNLCFV